MRSALPFIAALSLLAGCSTTSSGSDTITRFYDDGRAKPIVAILPVIDNSGQDFPWNLSEELSYSIYNRVAKRGNFWIDSFVQNAKVAKNLPRHIDLFGKDISWVKTRFPNHEFVTVLELIEHDIHEKTSKNSFLDKVTPSCELDMAIRVRVFDVRSEKPEIVLQEVISQSNLIPRQTGLTDKGSDRWRQKTYTVSPLGFSHLQLSKEVVRRIEEYVHLAKSKH